jgi:hypothetical protein
MLLLTSDGNESESAEQKFSKVNGSRLGWSSGDVLINCRKAQPPMSTALKFLSLFLCVYRHRGPYRVVTAKSTFYTVLVVVLGYTVYPPAYPIQIQKYLGGGGRTVMMSTLTYIPKLRHFFFLQSLPGTARLFIHSFIHIYFVQKIYIWRYRLKV